MRTIAYVVNDIGYLSHVVPLIEGLQECDHVILTPLKATAEYAKDFLGFKAVWCEVDQDIWRYTQANGIENAVILYQTMGGTIPAQLNTIQMFHGVSFKGPHNGINWPPDRWSHVLMQGIHYYKPYRDRYLSQKDKIHVCSFPRAVYYDGKRTKGDYILYMPTHKDGTKHMLWENLELVCKLGMPTKVKMHPINLRNPDMLAVIDQMKSDHPQVEFIYPDQLDYVRYEKLFLESICMISDFSSVICEYTLTHKPIIILRGSERRPAPGRKLGHLHDKVFHLRDRRDPVFEMNRAFKEHRFRHYPQIYFTQPNILDKIRELLK
jgi:hypothetical protein